MKPNLKSGFYWVKISEDTEFEVACYHKSTNIWYVIGEEGHYDKDEIFEINYNQIIMDNVQHI